MLSRRNGWLLGIGLLVLCLAGCASWRRPPESYRGQNPGPGWAPPPVPVSPLATPPPVTPPPEATLNGSIAGGHRPTTAIPTASPASPPVSAPAAAVASVAPAAPAIPAAPAP